MSSNKVPPTPEEASASTEAAPAQTAPAQTAHAADEQVVGQPSGFSVPEFPPEAAPAPAAADGDDYWAKFSSQGQKLR